MAERPRAVVMASGAGTNFAHVVQRVAEGALDLALVHVFANKNGAPVLDRARALGIDATLISWDRAHETRAAYDRRLLDAVAAEQPSVLLLLGWMHILSAEFIARFAPLINIHPAYLPLDGGSDTVETPDGGVIPAFRGAHALADAIAAGSAWTGATCHLVTPEVDRGPVLAREAMRLEPGESLEAAYARLRPLEYRVLEAGIRVWLDGGPSTSSG